MSEKTPKKYFPSQSEERKKKQKNSFLKGGALRQYNKNMEKEQFVFFL
jgi:hypothetical protein